MSYHFPEPRGDGRSPYWKHVDRDLPQMETEPSLTRSNRTGNHDENLRHVVLKAILPAGDDWGRPGTTGANWEQLGNARPISDSRPSPTNHNLEKNRSWLALLGHRHSGVELSTAPSRVFPSHVSSSIAKLPRPLPGPGPERAPARKSDWRPPHPAAQPPAPACRNPTSGVLRVLMKRWAW